MTLPPRVAAPPPPPRTALLSPVTYVLRPDPQSPRAISGPHLAPCARRVAQRIKAPDVRHNLALLDHPNTLGWPSLSGHTGAPSSPPRADGGARASTWRAHPLSQRMTSPVPALLARDLCHCPCLPGTSTGGAQRPTGAAREEMGRSTSGGSLVLDRHSTGRGPVSKARSLRPPPPPPPGSKCHPTARQATQDGYGAGGGHGLGPQPRPKSTRTAGAENKARYTARHAPTTAG